MNVPSKRRNPVLADIFNRLKYMDRRGSGFKKILTGYKNQNNFKEELKPMFNSGFGSFTLTLYNLNYGIPELNGTQEERQDGRQDRRQDGRQDGRQEEPPKIVNVSLSEILEYCKTPRSIKEILEFCGAKSRTTFIKNHLAPLISEGKLRMTIPDKPNSYTSQDFS